MVHAGEVIQIFSTQGYSFESYFSCQNSTFGPGVIILGDQSGLQPWSIKVADEFAKQGYLVCLPNLGWHQHTQCEYYLQNGQRIQKAEEAISTPTKGQSVLEQSIEIIESVFNKVTVHPACNGKIAIVDFSSGGTYSFLTAARLDPDVAIVYYPIDLQRHLGEGKYIDCQTILHIGRNDTYMKEETIKKIHAALIGKFNLAIYQYDAGHAFANSDDLSHFQPEAKQLSFQRTFDLLDSLK